MASPATRRDSAEDGGGIPLAVPIALAALLAFGAGVGLGRRRRERAAAAPEPSPEPQAPRRFVARDYPLPTRPAPPPPPVPRRTAQFEAGLEAEARKPATRAVSRQPGPGGPR